MTMQQPRYPSYAGAGVCVAEVLIITNRPTQYSTLYNTQGMQSQWSDDAEMQQVLVCQCQWSSRCSDQDMTRGH